MRHLIATLTLAALAVGAPAAAVAANGPDVRIDYSPALQKKIAKDYGEREKRTLEELVQRSLAREFGSKAARIDVTLEDVTPNRPTFAQMSRQPGLSFQSFGLGGARASGRAYDASGALIGETTYDWQGMDIRWAQTQWTWSDASHALDRFARRLAAASAD